MNRGILDELPVIPGHAQETLYGRTAQWFGESSDRLDLLGIRVPPVRIHSEPKERLFRKADRALARLGTPPCGFQSLKDLSQIPQVFLEDLVTREGIIHVNV